MPTKHVNFRLEEATIQLIIQHKQTNNFSNITEALEDIIKKGVNARSIPTSDIPSTSPSLQERAATNPALKEVLQNIQKPIVAPSCPFCAKVSDTEIECGKTLKEGKKPIRMTIESCQQCWERREYIRKKLERAKEDKEAEDGFPKMPNCKNLYRKTTKLKGEIEGKPFIYCIHFGMWKTPEFCWDCFQGHKSSIYVSEVSTDEELEGDA